MRDRAAHASAADSGRRDDLPTAPLFRNQQYMFEHPDTGENHNAALFRSCYRRVGELIPELLDAGLRPRVIVEYLGTLLHGCADGRLRRALRAPRSRWTGAILAPWNGWDVPGDIPVAPSTPVQDYALHVRAWQQHFGALFGLEAPRRVRSFSPSELALPNHPDVADAFVRTLVQAGYRWVLAQERAVEPSDGQGPRDPGFPRVLSRSNCGGESAGILRWARRREATPSRSPRCSPTMRRTLERATLDGRSVPLVTRIADGENGGAMMNECGRARAPRRRC